MASKKFYEILARIPQKLKNFNRISMSIAAFIDDSLKLNHINQRTFAELMGKKESEISKWLSGKHNFTIKSIANIEAKLDVQILYTPIDIKNSINQSLQKNFYDFIITSDLWNDVPVTLELKKKRFITKPLNDIQKITSINIPVSSFSNTFELSEEFNQQCLN